MEELQMKDIFVKKILPLFQCMGVCAKSTNRKIDKYLFVVSIIHTMILSSILWFVYVNRYKVFYMDTKVGTITDVIQLTAPILTHFIMLIEAQNFRQMDLKMWSLIEKVDLTLKVSSATNNISMSKAITFNISCLIFDIYVIVSVHPVATEWARLCTARIFSFCIERLMITHYVLYMDYIENRLALIKEQIEQLPKQQLRRKMVTINKLIYTHNGIWKLSKEINKRSTYAILATLIDNFLILTVNSYWIYTKLSYKHRHYAFIHGNYTIYWIFFYIPLYVHTAQFLNSAFNYILYNTQHNSLQKSMLINLSIPLITFYKSK